MYVTSRGNKYGNKLYFDYYNGKWWMYFMFVVGVWFYLTYEKRGESTY